MDLVYLLLFRINHLNHIKLIKIWKYMYINYLQFYHIILFLKNKPVIAKHVGFSEIIVSTKTVTSSIVWPGVAITLTSGQIWYPIYIFFQ